MSKWRAKARPELLTCQMLLLRLHSINFESYRTTPCPLPRDTSTTRSFLAPSSPFASHNKTNEFLTHRRTSQLRVPFHQHQRQHPHPSSLFTPSHQHLPPTTITAATTSLTLADDNNNIASTGRYQQLTRASELLKHRLLTSLLQTILECLILFVRLHLDILPASSLAIPLAIPLPKDHEQVEAS
jgi:hypothetical protein